MDARASDSVSGSKYDVFLSFRGADTRKTFTISLFYALDAKNIVTFIDNQLERGDDIDDSLMETIECSRISIVIFSKDYAGSASCLEELDKISKCREHRGQLVLPVFYEVNRSDVQNLTGSYAASLAKLEARLEVDPAKMQQWKSALAQISKLDGYHFDGVENVIEADFIQEIVQRVSKDLNRAPLHVADHPVGLEFQVDKMNDLLSMGTDDILMVGILGTGGTGKTTIAKAVFNKIANQFKGSSFVEVGNKSTESDLLQLQETLLRETLGREIKLGNSHRGVNVIKDRLHRIRVLIVIDDVENPDQLNKLAGAKDWFGPGSRIIITTRDEKLLKDHGVVKRHSVKGLSIPEALVLLSWHAFGKPQPNDGYLELSHSVVEYTECLPLALVILGSLLRNRSTSQWNDELTSLDRDSNDKISDILQRSYNTLNHNEKCIFLHIACFFKGQDKDKVERILVACDSTPTEVTVLVEKSLIRIENNKIVMHGLVQAMGRRLVNNESKALGKRSRLWSQDDVIRVLTEYVCQGPYETQALVVDLPDSEEVSAEALAKMGTLQILIVSNAKMIRSPESLPGDLRWIEWSECPLTSMPSGFRGRKLVGLHLPNGRIRQLGSSFKYYVSLKYLNLRGCRFLIETPDFSATKDLESLILDNCEKLVKVHGSVGYLEKLKILSLEECSNLRFLPSRFKLKHLHTLVLTGCKNLEMFPEIEEEMKELEKLCLNGTAIEFLPSSIEKISGLKVLNLTYCKQLNTLPSSIYKFRHLTHMLLEGCEKLGKFPLNEELSTSSSPAHLSTQISCNSSDTLTSYRFRSLKFLDLGNCNLLDVNFLSTPNCFGKLRDIDLSGNNFVSVPASIQHLNRLRSLKLSKCRKLKEIPKLPLSIKRVEARDCTSLERCRQLPRLFEFNSVKSTRLNDIDLTNCCNLAESQIEILDNCLRSKGVRGNSRIEMFLPGNQIPEWFSHTWENTSYSFEETSQTCEKLAALALCAVVKLGKDMSANISREVFINGQSVLSFSREFFSMETDHVWLYYLPCHFTKSVTAEKNDSVHFEVSFRVLGSEVGSPLKQCGVYLVYRQCQNVDDLSGDKSVSRQLTSVSLDLKRSWEDDVLELNLYPKKRRTKSTEDSLVVANTSAEHQSAALPGNHSTEQLASPLVADNSKAEPVVEEHLLDQWLSLDLKSVDQMTLNPEHAENLEGRVRSLSGTTTSGQQLRSRHSRYKGNFEL